jgi:hypothetical protein
MARKPTPEELRGDDFERFEVNVPVYRRKAAGTLYFKDYRGTVLDRFVVVEDQAGLAVVTERQSKTRIKGVGGQILRLGVAILTGEKALPRLIGEKLLGLADRDFSNARVVRDAIQMAQDDQPREAVLTLVDRFGPDRIRRIFERYAEDPESLIYTEMLKALDRIMDRF